MMASESGLEQRAPASVLEEAVRALQESRFTAALTGAGISAASGISPFRGNGGLWDHFPPEQYATLETFLSNPKKAWEMFAALGHQVCNAVPNAAHESLARLEQMGLLHAIITQNVDELHTRAGNKTVLELHGSHRELICLQCRLRKDVEDWDALGVEDESDYSLANYDGDRHIKGAVLFDFARGAFDEKGRIFGEYLTNLKSGDMKFKIWKANASSLIRYITEAIIPQAA